MSTEYILRWRNEKDPPQADPHIRTFDDQAELANFVLPKLEEIYDYQITQVSRTILKRWDKPKRNED